MKRTRYFIAIFALSVTFTVSGQKLDPFFHSPLPVRAAFINGMVIQPDGKILLGGDINFYGTQTVHNLIRLNSDGSLDTSFSFQGSDEFIITHLALLASGEIVALTRKFDTFNSIQYPDASLVKLNADGSVIHQVVIQPNTRALAVDANGKILIGVQSQLLRYNNDLTFDSNLGFSPNGIVSAIAITDDQILVAGLFSTVNGVQKNDIVKLNEDGSFDEAFDTGTGTNGFIGALTVQPDGKILLGKVFVNSFNGVPASGLMRLHSNGDVDTDFLPPSVNGPVSQAVVTESGIYFAAFIDLEGQTKDRLFRLNISDGTLDATFAPAQLDDSGSLELMMGISDGQVVANRTQAFGNVFGLSKINADGTYDTTFAPETGRYGTIMLADVFHGNLLLAGDFIRMDGIETYNLARCSLQGDVDETFRLKENKGIVRQIKVLDSDNILVSTNKHFFKLNAGGDLKPDFSWTPFKFLFQVVKFKVLSDGKIMAADGNLIYRLNSDGSEDESFAIQDICCIRSTVFDFDVQGEKVIYGSAFSAIGDVVVNRLARLTANADVDPTFNPGTGPNQIVSLIKVLNNKEILIGGFFNQFDGRSVILPLIKLSENGAFNDEFYNNLQSNPALPRSIVGARRIEQLGSKIYFQDRTGIYAIGVDGKVDTDFHIPAVVSAVTDIITMTDDVSGGRMKSDEALLYTLGSFRLAKSSVPSFVLKMQVTNEPMPSNIITGAEETLGTISSFGVEIYPHPVKSKLNIKMEEPAGNYDAAIFDLSGKKHIQTNFSVNGVMDTHEIDVHQTPPGIYLLKITKERGRSSFVKFVKGH